MSTLCVNGDPIESAEKRIDITLRRGGWRPRTWILKYNWYLEFSQLFSILLSSVTSSVISLITTLCRVACELIGDVFEDFVNTVMGKSSRSFVCATRLFATSYFSKLLQLLALRIANMKQLYSRILNSHSKPSWPWASTQWSRQYWMCIEFLRDAIFVLFFTHFRFNCSLRMVLELSQYTAILTCPIEIFVLSSFSESKDLWLYSHAIESANLRVFLFFSLFSALLDEQKEKHGSFLSRASQLVSRDCEKMNLFYFNFSLFALSLTADSQLNRTRSMTVCLEHQKGTRLERLCCLRWLNMCNMAMIRGESIALTTTTLSTNRTEPIRVLFQTRQNLFLSLIGSTRTFFASY